MALIIMLMSLIFLSWHNMLWGYILMMVLYSLKYKFELIPFLSLNQYLNFDSLSTMLILLLLMITFLMNLCSQKTYLNKIKTFMFSALILMLTMILFLSFCVSSLLHFYFLFESSLLLIMLIILGWGHQPERLQASLFLMMYTISASLPLLMMLMFIHNEFYFFNMLLMSYVKFKMSLFLINNFSFLALYMAFFVKLPIFFIHSWLPKAHVEAPMAGSMILAALLLKLGGYGIIRFPMLLVHTHKMLWFFLSVSIWGGTLASLLCLQQVDYKSLVAYSSIGHMSLILLGLFSNCSWGYNGSSILMVAHGLSSSGLFMIIGALYEKTFTRMIYIIKGIIYFSPMFSLFMFMLCLSNMATPPTINLSGELMIYLAGFFMHFMYLILLTSMSFLATVYSVYLYISMQTEHYYPKMTKIFKLESINFVAALMHLIMVNCLIICISYLNN